MAVIRTLNRQTLIRWLRETRPEQLALLWQQADAVRARHVGGAVHLRGLVELSNHCRRACHYCGIRAGNRQVRRYRMTADEIMECAQQAVRFGYGTVVLQAGEDMGIKAHWLAEVIRRIKQQTPLAVTLSLGERSDPELKLWRAAGADRYLLRFETSNPALYRSIHPPLPGKRSNRIALLRRLRKFGYEIGSGIMIGIPGQTFEDLAADLELFRELDLDMIGVGPFIPHPQTPLGKSAIKAAEQVPNDELMTYKVMALTRLVCPRANIPSTSALATLNLAQGRELGLQRGANIVMPNLTPTQYRRYYEIYPAKACLQETAEQCHGCIKRRIISLGRSIGLGTGSSRAAKKTRNIAV